MKECQRMAFFKAAHLGKNLRHVYIRLVGCQLPVEIGGIYFGLDIFIVHGTFQLASSMAA